MNHVAFLSEKAIEREKKTKNSWRFAIYNCNYQIENKELISMVGKVDKDERELRYDRFSSTISSCSTSSPGRTFYLVVDCAGGCYSIYDQRDG